MIKHAKLVEIELTRGAILPRELTHLLTIAARDATCSLITVSWSDGYEASVTDITEIEPIEDAEGIRSISAMFHYDDNSNLTIWLNQRYRSTLWAVGEEARQRQSAIAQYWASLPQRSSLAYGGANWLRSLPVALFGGALTFFAAGFFYVGKPHSMAMWTLRVGFLLLTLCLYLFVRSTNAIRTFSRLVILARRHQQTDRWTVVAGIAAIATLCLGLVAYLFPR